MRITVFTPTYNRGYIIKNLYNSLKRQTFFDFEWLVVDDGSNDNTEELLKRWINEENKLTIRYYKKENGGKHRAINYALDKASGELFFTVDSDDYLTSDALEKINKWEHALDKNIKFAGIVANTGYSEKETINTLFKEEYLDFDLLQRYAYTENGKKVLDGERAYIFYTDTHRLYKYPEFDGENFMTEAVVWNRMANDGYVMRYFNDIIWIFKYLEDGLTKAGNKLFLNNPRGYGLWLKEKSVFEKQSFYGRIKLYYNFYCELHKLYDIEDISKAIGTSKNHIKIISLIKKIKSILC
ncbi:glycosyltransferase family 2 protein [Terrisporobacter glycolicus]|uniref:glycosyltransferase family 2 protein n=1 Tax=Terrisporobacter glycolicus TaxID=36841 RepID=UPI000A74035C